MNHEQYNQDYFDYNWDASTIHSETPSTQAYSNTATIPTSANSEDTISDTGTEDRVSPEPSVYSLTSSLRDQSIRHVHGRGLNAHSDVYSLPVDDEEAQRLYKQHELFYYLAHNDNYYGMWHTVREVMAPTTHRQRAALDLGCGPGAWTIQCAMDFPHADVLGVDLAPTTSIVPPPNCRFEIDDLNLGLEHFYGDTFDLVHARLLNSGVKDYAGIVDQVSRSLRPGGLAIFAEIDFRVWSEDKRLLLPPNFYTPLPSQNRLSLAASTTTRPTGGGGGGGGSGARGPSQTKLVDWAVPTFFATLSKCVRAKGGNIDSAALLKTWMKEHPNYEDVRTTDLWCPLGFWTPTILNEWTTHPNFRSCQGRAQDNFVSLAKGARPLLYCWFSEQEVAELEGNAVRELLEDRKPMYIRVQVTSARKRRTNV